MEILLKDIPTRMAGIKIERMDELEKNDQKEALMEKKNLGNNGFFTALSNLFKEWLTEFQLTLTPPLRQLQYIRAEVNKGNNRTQGSEK